VVDSVKVVFGVFPVSLGVTMLCPGSKGSVSF
jgi:hypothetical protein